MKSATLLFGALIFAFSTLFAQNPAKIEKQLKKDISFLASDKLEGRLAGSENEIKAAEYIKGRFEKIGLKPDPFSTKYYDYFTFSPPIKLADEGNSLVVENIGLALDNSYYPVALSGNGSAEGTVLDISFGIVAPELGHNDLEGKVLTGKVVLLNLGSPDGIHPHSRYLKYHNWRERLEFIAKQAPAAIIAYNCADDISVKGLRAFNNLKQMELPIVYVTEVSTAKDLADKKVNLSVQLIHETKTGRNVVGYLDNGANQTVVIGAHYDHLGYGEYGNSLYTGEPAIHNGADDNASGVALMLSLAEKIVSNKNNLRYNYLFLAFSAEELGLLGSKAFVNAGVFKKFRPVYMLNFDMVGRLNSENDLGVYGNGTSQVWNGMLQTIDSADFKISRNPSGMGSSDHTSFYLSEVPCLHLFTGSHADYHKPSDDEDKINYGGMLKVLDYAYQIVLAADKMDDVPYRKTKSGSSRKAPSFKVTLGIIPDYFGDAKGLKIDGVSAGKPAEKAGLMKGDIIVKLGDTEVKDMMTYMNALGAFDKGDKTTVEVLRNGELLKMEINF
ncbi:M28 family peptidase [bacterium]|nr:M28 family peptidase [bacterium]